MNKISRDGFTINQLVRVTKELNGHEFKIGEIVRIANTDMDTNDVDPFICRNLSNNNSYWYLSSEEFEEIKSDVVSSNVSSKNNLTKAFVYSQSGKCPPVDGSVFESFILKRKKLDKNDHSFNETGFNHRIEYGIEVKEDVVVGWTLEIECIKDFIESNGDCILRFDKDIRMLCITIKDVEVL